MVGMEVSIHRKQQLLLHKVVQNSLFIRNGCDFSHPFFSAHEEKRVLRKNLKIAESGGIVWKGGSVCRLTQYIVYLIEIGEMIR